MQILEAFRALNALNEDVFSLDADGIKGLSDFKNNDDFEDDVSIIDPEAETTEDLQDNYIGKVILDCCVCHSKLYKAKEDVTIDETGELANVGEECPYCFTPDGFKVIGEVVAFEGTSEDTDEESEAPEAETNTKDDLDEGLFDKFKKNKSSDDDSGNKNKNRYYVMVEVDKNGNHTLVGRSQQKADSDYNFLDMMRATDREKRNGRLKVMSVAEAEKAMRTDLSRLIKESIEDFSMTANDTHVEVGEDENGKVTVTMEPATADGGEMIAPVSDETEAELLGADEEAPVDGEESTEEAPAEDEVDIEVDEVDEESMDELGESYFKRVYENVNNFKTTAVKQQGNSLVVEGKIKFTNGKVRKTSFMFEALDTTKAGKVRFVGDNKNLTEGKKAFMLTGKMKGNKLIAESLNYNYKHKDAEGKVSRVYGTERTSRR